MVYVRCYGGPCVTMTMTITRSFYSQTFMSTILESRFWRLNHKAPVLGDTYINEFPAHEDDHFY